MDAVVGSNSPTIRLLNKLVKKSATHKWYDLGIELLEPEDIHELDVIQSNYPRDAGMCCTKMFQLWLERQPNASWRQLIQALKEVEMNELANNIEQKLMSINEGLMLKASTNPSMPQQQAIPQQPLSSPVTFTQDEPIDDAFIKLSAFVTSLIQNANFPSLQRACIEKANSPKMLLKSEKIMPVLKEAQSFHTLCLMLAGSSYWNFLDTRIMEAMAIASGIPAAQEAIENFKKTFYNMTLKEAAPYFPVMHAKSDYAAMHEELDTDPSQMTIGDLHKHRFYLENEIIQAGPDTCTIRKIMIGSVVVIWQIHVDHVYQTYSRLKRLPSLSQLQAIRYISIPEAELWEGLPVLWHGQDVDEIGPIESSPCVSQDPYPLPQGFEWNADISHSDEITQLYKGTHPSFLIPQNLLEWLISSPLYKKGCLLKIQLSSSKKLISLVASVPVNIRVGRKVLPLVKLRQVAAVNVPELDVIRQLFNAATKEAMRMLGHEGVFQAVISGPQRIIPKSVVTYDVYVWYSQLHSLPYTTPGIVGLRRMKPSDVPKALVLTNQYTSQFEIAQVFQSEEEFSHWFLSPLLDDLATYVVEEPNSGNITDMFSFRIAKDDITLDTTATVIALVITKTPTKQLITDLILCAKQQNASVVYLPQFGLKERLFKDFCYGNQRHFAFYNYKYPEVDDNNFCVFEHANSDIYV